MDDNSKKYIAIIVSIRQDKYDAVNEEAANEAREFKLPATTEFFFDSVQEFEERLSDIIRVPVENIEPYSHCEDNDGMACVSYTGDMKGNCVEDGPFLYDVYIRVYKLVDLFG